LDAAFETSDSTAAISSIANARLRRWLARGQVYAQSCCFVASDIAVSGRDRDRLMFVHIFGTNFEFSRGPHKCGTPEAQHPVVLTSSGSIKTYRGYRCRYIAGVPSRPRSSSCSPPASRAPTKRAARSCCVSLIRRVGLLSARACRRYVPGCGNWPRVLRDTEPANGVDAPSQGDHSDRTS
jgi:hypothetical protein